MKVYFTILVIIFSVTFCFAQDYDWGSASFAKTTNNYIPRSKIKITTDNHKLFAGQFEQNMNYKGITLTSALGYGSFVAMLDENDSLLWIKKFSENHIGAGGVSFIEVFDDNYFYININIKDSVFVDNQLYVTNQAVPSYHKNLILKFDMNGNVIDNFYLDGTCYNFITGIFLDIEKNIYIFGDYGNDDFNTTSSCTCVFDNQTFSTTKANVFLAKYDSLGNLIWINTFGDNKYIGSIDFSVIDDAIYISGFNMYASDIDFGSFTLTYPNNYANGAFMAKYDTSGNFKWAKYYGVKGWDSNVGPKGLIALSANKIIVCGSVGTQSESAHLYFQNSPPLYGLVIGGGEFNYYIICYDSLGNIVWNDLAQCDGRDYIASMASDSKSNLYVTGNYSYKLYFGNDTLPYVYDDLWVGAFDSVGNKLWAKKAGGSGSVSGIDIEVDSEDNIYVNGTTTSNPTIVGDSSYTINGPSVFIAKMTPSIVSSTTNILAPNPNKKLLKVVDVLGRKTIHKKNTLLFYIYSDGTVEKKVFVE
jgi:hypothetical protein